MVNGAETALPHKSVIPPKAGTYFRISVVGNPGFRRDDGDRSPVIQASAPDFILRKAKVSIEIPTG